MEEVNCPLCPPGTPTRIFLRSQQGKALFTYVQCRGCGLVFLRPRPGAAEIQEFYAEDYYGEGSHKFRSWLEVPRNFFAWNRVRRVRKYFSRPGKVLDIGCGQGTFLQMLQNEGWKCWGTELTEESARRTSRLGIPVYAGEFDENRFPPHSFDLITLWQVLEHLPDPGKILKGSSRLLKKGGILAISTPNIDSLQARISAEQWFHLDPPRHLYLFSPRTLQRMMESLGLDLLNLRYFSLEQNPYGWLQSLMNLQGFPQNQLYSILKNTPTSRKRRLFSLQQGKTLLWAAGLLPSCLLLSLAMAWMEKGGTLEAYFRPADRPR